MTTSSNESYAISSANECVSPAWAAGENRVLITNDRTTMVDFACRRVAAGDPMPGLIATTNTQALGEAIEDILLIADGLTEDEARDHVVIFLPYRG